MRCSVPGCAGCSNWRIFWGNEAIVRQQFGIGGQILGAGFVPVIEAEVGIFYPTKAVAGDLPRKHRLGELDAPGPDGLVMFKLTMPGQDPLHADCMDRDNCIEIVALSGKLPRGGQSPAGTSEGIEAGFSRALSKGIKAQRPWREIHAMLGASVQGTASTPITRISSRFGADDSDPGGAWPAASAACLGHRPGREGRSA